MKEPRHAVTGERDTGRIVREIRIYFLIWETMFEKSDSIFSNDLCLMVYRVAWEIIEAWFSEVKEYRICQNDKMNYL